HLELARALPGHAEARAELLEGHRLVRIAAAEEDQALPLVQRAQRLRQPLAQQAGALVAPGLLLRGGIRCSEAIVALLADLERFVLEAPRGLDLPHHRRPHRELPRHPLL